MEVTSLPLSVCSKYLHLNLSRDFLQTKMSCYHIDSVHEIGSCWVTLTGCIVHECLTRVRSIYLGHTQNMTEKEYVILENNAFYSKWFR